MLLIYSRLKARQLLGEFRANKQQINKTPIVTFTLKLFEAKLAKLFIGNADALDLLSTQGSPIIRWI